MSSGKRIVVIGAGAIGGYTGALMARGGEDVTLIDPWPEHVEYIRSHGMQLSGLTPQETHSIKVPALHIGDVQQLARGRPVDIAFISVKSYDTEWAAQLIKPYLAPNGFVVSLQNCINEERHRGRRRLGQGARLHREPARRRIVRAGARQAHDAHGRRALHYVSRRRSPWPRHAARGGSRAHPQACRQFQSDDQSVGRALVEARHQFDAQRVVGGDRAVGQRARSE